ncbi:SDR family NAD(P)-dependent oxidoreductase [Nonomuraea sp. NPDC049607]|uniref:SDR family NAD(P)-dependent oxidoreductase n=1 Tax=Nonomuraea sp. NPDC049607 TaxID=3154732 RepID=UPI0034470A46
MTITFVTGANKGLGHETARRLIELGHTVLLGARHPERGTQAATALGARLVRIDVTRRRVSCRSGRRCRRPRGTNRHSDQQRRHPRSFRRPATLSGTDAMNVFDANLAGVVRTTTAFLPRLRRSPDPVIINVSSGMGSLAHTRDPSRPESSAIAPPYTASKAALTMTTQYAKALPTSASTPPIPATPSQTSTATAAPNRRRRHGRDRRPGQRNARRTLRTLRRPNRRDRLVLNPSPPGRVTRNEHHRETFQCKPGCGRSGDFHPKAIPRQYLLQREQADPSPLTRIDTRDRRASICPSSSIA